MIRNKRNHFTEIPAPLRAELFGDSPVALVPFILHPMRFPKLLMAAYDTTLEFLADEEVFQSYLGRITSKMHASASIQAKADAVAASSGWQPARQTSAVSHRASSSKAVSTRTSAAACRDALSDVSGQAVLRAGRGWFVSTTDWITAATGMCDASVSSIAIQTEIIPGECGIQQPGTSSRGRLIAGWATVKETKYKGGAKVWDARYKSVPCSNWEGNLGAFCPRGLRCDFAHGAVELRRLELLKVD
jgi:hypothetical protein